MIRNDLLTPSHTFSRVSALPNSPPIFIVEKNPSIAQMITWALALAGYSSTRSAPELSTLFKNSPEELPALILLDVSLVQESGGNMLLDVQAQCFSMGITPPIIVLTTNPIIQREVEAIGYRAILKPFHVQDLTEAVREALCLPFLLHEPGI